MSRDMQTVAADQTLQPIFSRRKGRSTESSEPVAFAPAILRRGEEKKAMSVDDPYDRPTFDRIPLRDAITRARTPPSSQWRPSNPRVPVRAFPPASRSSSSHTRSSLPLPSSAPRGPLLADLLMVDEPAAVEADAQEPEETSRDQEPAQEQEPAALPTPPPPPRAGGQWETCSHGNGPDCGECAGLAV
jgi:hypothetical protein